MYIKISPIPSSCPATSLPQPSMQDWKRVAVNTDVRYGTLWWHIYCQGVGGLHLTSNTHTHIQWEHVSHATEQTNCELTEQLGVGVITSSSFCFPPLRDLRFDCFFLSPIDLAALISGAPIPDILMSAFGVDFNVSISVINEHLYLFVPWSDTLYKFSYPVRISFCLFVSNIAYF